MGVRGERLSQRHRGLGLHLRCDLRYRRNECLLDLFPKAVQLDSPVEVRTRQGHRGHLGLLAQSVARRKEGNAVS